MPPTPPLAETALPALETRLHTIRNGIIDNVLRAMLWLTPVALLASLSRVFSIGWQPIMLFQTGSAVAVVGLWLLRQRLSLHAKTWGLIVLMLLISLNAHLHFGLLAAPVGVLVAAPCVAAIIFGTRGGVLILAGSILIQVGAASYIITTGTLPPFDIPRYLLSPEAWILKGLGLMLSTCILFAALSWYSRCLVNALIEAKHNEQRLEEMQAELERRVLARTAELATARAEAEAANAVKTRFMSNVSHEMRTPMQSILGFAQIGKRKIGKATPEELYRYFDNIEQSGQRMQSLVESLLSLAQAAWNEHSCLAEEQLQAISPLRLAEQSVATLTPGAMQRGQQIVLENRGTTATIRGDQARLGQVLDYLIGNALRYSPERTTVTVRLEDIMAAHGKPALRIDILDEGCGVPEQELTAIFEPFYQSTRTATGAGGTGLGLALCMSIIKRHRGTLQAANRPEGGAIFSITLPVAAPPA